VNRRALFGAALASVTGCGSNGRSPLHSVKIAAGTPQGVYHELAKAFAAEIRSRWRIPADVLTSNESIDNLRMVAEGHADIGFATVDICDLALQGDWPFSGVLPIAALAGLYEDYLQIIIADSGQIAQLRDLRNRRVSLGGEKSGTEFVADRILRTVGLDQNKITSVYHLPADVAAIQMLAGSLDAFFVMGGLPTLSVQDLAGRMKVRLLSIPDEAGYVRDDYRQIYLLRSIPSGTYGMDREISTIGVGNVMVIHKDAPDETAFRLTELLLASKQALVRAHPEALRLGPRTAVATFKIPLHQGALRYYRETKPFLG